MFVISVYTYVLSSGVWTTVGHVPPEHAWIPVPERAIVNDLRPNQCAIIGSDGTVRRATWDECVGLEIASAWAAEHVEERIRDHYAGRPNHSVKDLVVPPRWRPGRR